MLKSLLIVEEMLEDAYNDLDNLHHTDWVTDYQRHQVEAKIRYCESIYGEALENFQAVYF